MVTDQLADLLTRIRNAQKAKHLSVSMPGSNTKARILEVLRDEGYIAGFETVDEGNNKLRLKVQLRYDDRGEPVIRELKRLSRPGRRRYVSRDDIPRYRGGLGTVIVSTPQGMLTDQQARQAGVGGELICWVF